jgi:hypothetical protein
MKQKKGYWKLFVTYVLPVRTFRGLLGVAVCILWIAFCLMYINAFGVVVADDVAVSFLKSYGFGQALNALVHQPLLMLFQLLILTAVQAFVAIRKLRKAGLTDEGGASSDASANLLVRDLSYQPLFSQIEYLVMTRGTAGSSVMSSRFSRSPLTDAACASTGTVATWIAQVILSRSDSRTIEAAKTGGNVSKLLSTEYPIASRPLWEKLMEKDADSSRAVLISAAYFAQRTLQTSWQKRQNELSSAAEREAARAERERASPSKRLGHGAGTPPSTNSLSSLYSQL